MIGNHGIRIKRNTWLAMRKIESRLMQQLWSNIAQPYSRCSSKRLQRLNLQVAGSRLDAMSAMYAMRFGGPVRDTHIGLLDGSLLPSTKSFYLTAPRPAQRRTSTNVR